MDVPDCYPPLRLNVCPRCEYSLTAHPPAGVCPECGRAYEADEIVLFGYAMGDRANRWNSRPAGLISVIAGAAVALPFIWWSIRGNPLGLTIWTFLLLSGLAADLWRRHADADGAGLVQVKLTPRGFRQGGRQPGPLPFERSDAKTLFPWSKDLKVRVNLLEAGRVQLIVARDRTRWWPGRRELVNADLAVEPGQLDAISRRISVWLGDTGRALHAPPAPN